MKPVNNRARLSWLLAIATTLLLVAACAPPSVGVENTVLPQIFSIRTDGEQIFIQGRYLGSGTGGAEAGNYVLVDADMNRNGGSIYPTSSWSNSRIELTVPASVNLEYIYVYVDGNPSNGLFVNRR